MALALHDTVTEPGLGRGRVVAFRPQGMVDVDFGGQIMRRQAVKLRKNAGLRRNSTLISPLTGQPVSGKVARKHAKQIRRLEHDLAAGLIGVDPDDFIALRADVPVAVVRQFREKHGIPKPTRAIPIRKNHHIKPGQPFRTPAGRRGTVTGKPTAGYYPVEWSDGTTGRVRDSWETAYPVGRKPKVRKGTGEKRGRRQHREFSVEAVYNGKGTFALGLRSPGGMKILKRFDSWQEADKRYGATSDRIFGRNGELYDGTEKLSIYRKTSKGWRQFHRPVRKITGYHESAEGIRFNPGTTKSPKLADEYLARVATRIYEGLVAKGEPEGQRTLSRAYAIATSQSQKRGYMKAGSRELTAKGAERAWTKMQEPDARVKREAAEHIFAGARKAKGYRVVAVGAEFEVRPGDKRFKSEERAWEYADKLGEVDAGTGTKVRGKAAAAGKHKERASRTAGFAIGALVTCKGEQGVVVDRPRVGYLTITFSDGTKANRSISSVRKSNRAATAADTRTLTALGRKVA